MLQAIRVRNFRGVGPRPVEFNFVSGFTAFVGPNNAGKSSLLRIPYEFRNYFIRLTDPNEFLNSMKGPRNHGGFLDVTEQQDVFHNQNSEPIELSFSFDADGPTVGMSKPSVVRIEIGHDQNCRVSLLDATSGVIDPGPQTLQPEANALGGGGNQVDITDVLSALGRLASSTYLGPFRNAVNVGGSTAYYDMQIGTAAIDMWRRLKTGGEKGGHQAVADITSDIKTLFGFDELEIDSAESGTTLLLKIDGRIYWLPEVGAGLAHFVLILVTLAFRAQQLALVDEPELNLHPALQAKFVMALQKYASGGIAFATHSFGLAREVGDAIYTVREQEGGMRVDPLEHTKSLAELLGEMSFSGYRDLGYDTLLLVEGPTDVKTYRAILRIMRREHKTVILSLGGDDLIGDHRQDEFAELTRLADIVVAVVDSERLAPGDPPKANRAAFKRMCDSLDIPCHILDRRATENYLTDRAVKMVKGPAVSALGEFDALDGAWTKNDNWVIAGNMVEAEVAETDLGTFLREHIPSTE